MFCYFCFNSCLCVSANIHCLGWETPYWTSLLLWTKTSWTSKWKDWSNGIKFLSPKESTNISGWSPHCWLIGLEMLKVVVNYYPVVTHWWSLKGSFEWKMLNINAHIAPVTFTLELLRQSKMLNELCSVKDKAGKSIFLLHKAQSDQVRHRHVVSVRSPQWQADHKRTRLYDVIGSMRIRDNSGTREQSRAKEGAELADQHLPSCMSTRCFALRLYLLTTCF